MSQNFIFSILGKDKSGKAWQSATKQAKRFKSVVSSVQGVVGAVGAGMIGRQALGSLKESVLLYDQQAQAVGAVEQALKSTKGAAGVTSKELQAAASALQDMTTYGDEDILRHVTTPLLTFTKIAGPNLKRTQGLVLDMATALKMDLKGASLQVGKALQDPVKGVTALGRAGIVFTEQQKEVLKSLVETGNVAGAQTLILNELATQFGGQAKKAAESPLGATRQLANTWGDVKEEFGALAAEFLPPMVSGLKYLVSAVRDLPDPVKKGVLAFGALAGVAGVLIAGMAGVASVMTVAGAALGLLASPVVVIGGAIALLAAQAYFLTTTFYKLIGVPVIKWVKDTWATVKGTLDEWGSAATSFGETVYGVFSGPLSSAWNLVKSVAERVGSAVKSVLVALGVDVDYWVAVHVAAFNLAMEPLRKFWTLAAEMKDKAVGYVTDMVAGVKAQIMGPLNEAWAMAEEGIDKVKGFFFGLYDAVVGHSYVPDMVKGVESEMKKLSKSMPGEAVKAVEPVKSAFKDMLDSSYDMRRALKSAADSKESRVGVQEIAREFSLFEKQLKNTASVLDKMDGKLAGNAENALKAKTAFQELREELAKRRERALGVAASLGDTPLATKGTEDLFQQFEMEINQVESRMRLMAAQLPEDAKAATEKTEGLFSGLGESIKSDLNGILRDGKVTFDELKGVASNALNSMSQKLMDFAMDQVFNSVLSALPGMGGMGGGMAGSISTILSSVFHAGGVVGGPALMRAVPASTFAGAPRYHRGLASDEFPAILQKGETVIPRGGSAGRGVNVTIHNYGTSKKFDVQPIGPNDVKIIVNDELDKQFAGRMAGQARDPYSGFSQTQSKTTTVERVLG